VPANGLDFERKSSTRDSAATLLCRFSISPDSYWLADLVCCGCAFLRQLKVGLGDRIGDARREIRITRLEFDHDEGVIIDGVGGKTVEIGIQHAFFRRRREWITADPEHWQRF